jgi:hypothetical protein
VIAAWSLLMLTVSAFAAPQTSVHMLPGVGGNCAAFLLTEDRRMSYGMV